MFGNITLKTLIFIALVLIIAVIIIHFFFPLLILIIVVGIGYFIYKTYYRKNKWNI
jgi:hypothetical protein